jgi:hypothetical protein
MANECRIDAAISFNKGGVVVNPGQLTKSFDVTGSKAMDNVQAIGVANEAITFGDTVPGTILLKNLDDTNYVEIFLDSGNTEKVTKLLAGQFALIPGPTTTLYGRANTAPVNLLVIAIDA